MSNGINFTLIIYLNIKGAMNNLYAVWITPFENIHSHSNVILHILDLTLLHEGGSVTT